MSQTTGKLSSLALGKINKIAKSALSVGFERRSCRRADATAESKGVIISTYADIFPMMTLQLKGRSLAAPVRLECWNDVANDLLDIALAAARVDR